MARKLDSDILKSISAIAANTYRIEMLKVNQLIDNPDNFFEMSEIELLAEDIERQGLKHNLVVKPNGNNTYMIISGHRRFAAIKYLRENNRYKSELVPCFIDSAEKSEAEHKLNLIMLNATSRTLSDAQRLQQYRELKSTFEQLEREGKKLPGRMREKVAEAMQISPSAVSKIESIEKSSKELVSAVENGAVSINAAAKIAKLPTQEQSAAISAVAEKSATLSEIETQRKEKQRQNNKSQKGVLYRPTEPPLTMPQRTITLTGEDVAEIVMGLPDFLPYIYENRGRQLHSTLRRLIEMLSFGEEAEEADYEDCNKVLRA